MLFKSKGILGINARNLLYIRPYNKKKAIKLADNKLKTKQFLSARGIPVPKLYGVIRNIKELDSFDINQLSSSFVIKPNHGFGGEGIIPIVNKRDGLWLTAGGKRLTKTEIIDHIRDILDGRFSISNVRDQAFFEQLIISDEKLNQYSYEGLPDIRVVVHNLIPVMAMLRLPTKESEGKANLHLGAVGVGIDIAKGQATYISYKNRIIDELPDGLGKIHGLKIPYWDDILHIASQVQLITNLGYMAVDISLDKNTGPVLLEINARAGLGVQIANLAPLRKRLQRIEGIKVTTPQKGVRMAKDLFGFAVEKEIQQISGRTVVGTENEVEIIEKKGNIRAFAKIETGKTRSIIDEDFAVQNKLIDKEEYDEQKGTLKLKFTLKDKRIQTIVDIEKIPSKKFNMLLGKRDLKEFLVDPAISAEESKVPQPPKQKSTTTKNDAKSNFKKIDDQLIQVDNKIKLLYHLKPTNLEVETQKFLQNPQEDPQFEYPQLKFDPLELISDLEKIQPDDSPLGQIFTKKKQEIAKKIELLEALDEERFTGISTELYGKPSKKEVEQAKKMLSKIDISKAKDKGKIYSAQEAKERFDEVFVNYGLKNWKAKLKETMVADCTAGKNNRLFIRKDAKFSRERIESLIVHEIETHILTAENGKMQEYEIFNRGLANYLITQEGLAMFNVERERKTPFTKNYKALAHVIAISKSLTAGFSETYQYLIELGIPPKQAFKSCLKVKRGHADTSKPGAFTKDYIYFRGYYQVKNYVDDGGQLSDIYFGKFNLEDLELIKKIPQIKSAKLIPNWLK